ncbi:MAG: DUF1080 domain-containing protein, partial [Opitutales bacterium]|nr:DUF1080 domain-containing protein [Opitutales bacterium]
MKNLCLLITGLILSACSPNSDMRIAESQQKWIEVYEQQENFPNPEDMLVNTDPEPDLGSRFVSLYNGKNLDGWTPKGGHCEFEPKGDTLIGTTITGSTST